ncbi:ABC transporter permease subunit [Nocardioides sp. YIM 152588]|uniref:PhnE/PtxC family ABC transporter permease n=1 Tax=Nocardioides sp. YIM 152588 TaxID=3158259 RepID=UPI0032E443CB
MSLQLDPRAGDRARPQRTTGAEVLRRRLLTWAALLALLAWSAARAVPEGAVVNTGGLALLDDLVVTARDLSLDPEFLRIVLDATLTTVAFALLGTLGALVLGVAGGLVLSDVAWDRQPPPLVRALRLLLRGALVAVRAVHELVWALLFVSVLGLDPLVAVLALAVPFGAQTAQVFGETFDTVPDGPLRALRDAGARRVSALAYGLLPQALPLMLSYAFYRFECALRSVVVLGVAGVGGLGFELTVSLQSRNWEEVWTLVTALLVLSALVELWSSRVRRNLAIVTCADWVVGRSDPAEGRRSSRLSRPVRWSLWAVPPVAAAAWWWVGLSPANLFSERTRALTSRLLADMWPPAPPPGGWSTLVGASLDTIAMATLAMLIAVAITLVIGPWASRPRAGRGGSVGAVRWLAWGLARAVLLVLRSIPPTVWAVLALLALFPGIIPGAVALGLYTGGILARLVAEAWETVDLRPRDALRDAGVAPSVSAVLGVGPPSARHLVTYTLYRFEICVRDTAIVGVVGAAGLGRVLADRLAAFDFAAVTGVLVASFVVSAAVELVGRRGRRAW